MATPITAATTSNLLAVNTLLKRTAPIAATPHRNASSAPREDVCTNPINDASDTAAPTIRSQTGLQKSRARAASAISAKRKPALFGLSNHSRMRGPPLQMSGASAATKRASFTGQSSASALASLPGGGTRTSISRSPTNCFRK